MTKAEDEYKKDKNNKLAQWVLFILDPNIQEVKSIMSENKEIKETNEKLENISEDEHIRKRAEMLARWEFDEQSGKAATARYYKEKIEKGMQQGIQQGKKQGEKIGKQLGRKEEKIKIAKELLKNNVNFDIIKNSTGLSEEELNKLKNEKYNNIKIENI